MEICKTVEDISWLSHPLVKEVNIKPLVTKSEDGLNVTCMLVRVPAGIEVPEHIHEEQVDILYPRARFLLALGADALQRGQSIDPADIAPAYLRSKVAQKPRPAGS